MLYISPIISNIPDHLQDRFGYMVGLVSRPQDKHLDNHTWMLDNGAFTGMFTFDKWIAKLERLAPFASTCISAIVPDVVGNKNMTLEMWETYSHFPASLGYRVALAAQDGMTVEDIPWHEIDVLFIGGSREWKYLDSWPLIREAIRRHVWVHVGRVNSMQSIRTFACADSVDGTQLIYTPWYYKQILQATDTINARNNVTPLFDYQGAYE